MSVCQGCGTTVVKTGLRGPHPKWCGPCGVEARKLSQARHRDVRDTTEKNRLQRERRAAQKKEKHEALGPLVLFCWSCGAEIVRRRGMKGSTPRHCSFCAAFRVALQRADRAAVYASGEGFTATEIFERDKMICQLCGQVCKGVRPDPLSPSIDHVIPIARGGQHQRSNVQTAHLLCNMRKSIS